jgi:hypothetical protein
MTDNHNYNEPAEGTTDWHVPINSNWQDIDTDVEVRDTDANKSSYEAKPGAKFVATDSPHNVYLGDGSSWNFIGELGELYTDADARSAVYHALNPSDVVLNAGEELSLPIPAPAGVTVALTRWFVRLYDPAAGSTTTDASVTLSFDDDGGTTQATLTASSDPALDGYATDSALASFSAASDDYGALLIANNSSTDYHVGVDYRIETQS